jgi:hypothetical protein
MCIRRRLCRVLNHPDDGEDNARRNRGFGPFLSLSPPDIDDDPTWESRVIPADVPEPVLPFEISAREKGCEADRCEHPDCESTNYPKGCNLDPERPFARPDDFSARVVATDLYEPIRSTRPERDMSLPAWARFTVLPGRIVAWTDPDHEGVTHAEDVVSIEADLRGLQYDLSSLDID